VAPRPLWSIGFRPLFALGTLGAVAMIWTWVLVWSGRLAAPGSFPLLSWHAHEMVYGFAAAIVVGFLATASANWSGLPPLSGARLKLLCLLWVAGRIAMAIPGAPALVVAVVDLAFLPAAAFFLRPYFRGSKGNSRYLFPALLALWTAGSAAMHLGASGVFPGLERTGAFWGVHQLIIMIAVIAGRVLPFFSSRAVPGYVRPSTERLDAATPISTLLFAVAAAALGPEHLVPSVLAGVAAVFHLWRWGKWLDRGVWRVPILWILFVGYAWIPVGLLLLAVSPWVAAANLAGTHALTAGAIGTMIVAMVSRVSLGHTGRPIFANAPVLVAYALILIGSTIRVVGPFVASLTSVVPYGVVVTTSGTLWGAGFAVLALSLARLWWSPRADARAT
jgi:uncharacterized protein involved in response to NO